MGESLVQMLCEMLNNKDKKNGTITAECKRAWIEVYSSLSHDMALGAQYVAAANADNVKKNNRKKEIANANNSNILENENNKSQRQQ